MELIGRRFGHIRVTGVAGEGGMGEVYVGFDEKLERKVALKVLHADSRLDGAARERLLREARALSKLDHAHICRIHDYVESDDVDVLVLEFIDGRTLTEVIAEAPPYSERLRIATSVAEVLVTAHRAGIIHRDLKPDNIMLTKKGEVKVLDFGLARWLQGARVRSSDRQRVVSTVVPIRLGDTLPIPDDTSPYFTEAGIALGTPLYMSPEQARGETLTPASDMYSFGLLLQTLFTGTDPHPDTLGAREVMLRSARGESNPITGLHRDITGLIHRLKQFAPADRPTAVEAVERLGHLANKPQRIVRRIAAALLIAVIGAGGWRYAADLQRERAIALEAQTEAERRRAQAEDLIEFMLGDLRKKLEPVGRLDILDDVGERAMAYVKSLDPQSMTADELARSAKALNQLGDVRLAQGNTPEALRMFREAEKLTARAVDREPKNGRALLVHGATEFWLGHALWTQARYDEALPHMRQYMEVGEQLAALDPANREYVLERAYGHSGVALILEPQGDLQGALEHCRVSLEIKQALARRDPDDANAQAEVARAFNKVGALLYKVGDLRGALEHSRREVEIYRQLVRREPKHNPWKQRLAASMGYYSRALNDTGQTAAALALWNEELEIERELAALDPTNVNWKRAVAITALRVASISATHGERQRAEQLFREARARIAEAVTLAPTRTTFAAEAAQIETEFVRHFGGAAGGVSHLTNVVRRLEALPSKDRYARVQLAGTLLLLGDLAAGNNPEAARAHWQRAARELEPRLAANAAPSEQATWFRLLVRLDRLPEARAQLDRLQRTGYATSELQQLCSERGC